MFTDIDYINSVSIYIDLPGQEAVEYHTETMPNLRVDTQTVADSNGRWRVIIRVYEKDVRAKDNNVLF